MFFILFYLFLRETKYELGRCRERGRHRIRSRLQALSCQHRAWRRARTHGLWDHDLNRSQSPNQLSHPGALPKEAISEWWRSTANSCLSLWFKTTVQCVTQCDSHGSQWNLRVCRLHKRFYSGYLVSLSLFSTWSQAFPSSKVVNQRQKNKPPGFRGLT